MKSGRFWSRLGQGYLFAIPWMGYLGVQALHSPWSRHLLVAGWISLLLFQLLAGGLQEEGRRRPVSPFPLATHGLTLALLGWSQTQRDAPSFWIFLVETSLVEQGAFIVAGALVMLFLSKPGKGDAVPGILVILAAAGVTAYGLARTWWLHLPEDHDWIVASVAVSFALNLAADFRLIWALGKEEITIGDQLDVPAILLQILAWGLVPVGFYFLRPAEAPLP